MPKMSVEEMVIYGVNESKKIYIDDGDDEGNHEAAGVIDGQLNDRTGVLTMTFEPFEDCPAVEATTVRFIEIERLLDHLAASLYARTEFAGSGAPQDNEAGREAWRSTLKEVIDTDNI